MVNHMRILDHKLLPKGLKLTVVLNIFACCNIKISTLLELRGAYKFQQDSALVDKAKSIKTWSAKVGDEGACTEP